MAQTLEAILHFPLQNALLYRFEELGIPRYY
jgi:hypothetical protein